MLKLWKVIYKLHCILGQWHHFWQQCQLGSWCAGTSSALASPPGTPSAQLQLRSLALQQTINSLGQGLSSPALFLYHLTQGALSPLSSFGANSQWRWKNPPKDNPAWVTMASLGCLSCPISHPCHPLTKGSQGTDTEIGSHWQLCSQQHVTFMEIHRQICGLPYVKISKPW